MDVSSRRGNVAGALQPPCTYPRCVACHLDLVADYRRRYRQVAPVLRRTSLPAEKPPSPYPSRSVSGVHLESSPSSATYHCPTWKGGLEHLAPLTPAFCLFGFCVVLHVDDYVDVGDVDAEVDNGPAQTRER